MVSKDDLLFRQIFTLKDGARVLLRPLTKDDRQALLDFFLPVTAEERRYFRHDVSNSELVESWITNLDYDKVFPLVAVVGSRIVGNTTLHFHDGPARHRAEVRIFLAKDFRQRGLGVRMLQGLIELARRRSLYLLEVFIVSDSTQLIRAFHNAGFEAKCVFEDYFMLPDGGLKDINQMILRLRSAEEEF
jgi:RimJ/RimL family protein N-acetyltransferase